MAHNTFFEMQEKCVKDTKPSRDKQKQSVRFPRERPFTFSLVSNPSTRGQHTGTYKELFEILGYSGAQSK